ncbi:MAG: NAD(P)-dependent oxidoreductase [Betaproteobacteria bacterium]|nr:NAD(P)-dependent oxidoreductase [Betaproteobacteria bacterium]
MKVGFIGIGTMGGHMAYNLCKAEYEVTVSDLNRDLSKRHIAVGAQWADNVQQIAQGNEVVMTSLPGPKEVQDVALKADGLLANMKPGTAWFDLSTNSVTVVRALHAKFKEKGIHMLDAPVSGGPRGAESGKMALLVGGDKAVFEKYRKVLDAIGDQVFYIGNSGDGTVAKLVHNASGYAVQAAMAELITMGVKAGVDPVALWAALRQCALGRVRTFDRMGNQFMQHKFEPPDFALRLAHKDVTLATELAREIGVPMKIANITHAEMTEALNRGWGHLDSRSFLMLQKERAGVEIKVPAEAIKAVLDRDG